MNPIPLITLALAFLIYASPIAAHDEFVLDSRRATPGPRLDLVEVSPDVNRPGRKFHLHVQPGLPRNDLFRILTKDFSHGFHAVPSGFQLDDSGNLVSTESGEAVHLNEVIFDPGPYPRGAAWEAALVSVDRNIRLFAKTIPYPIVAHDGACTVSFELLSQSGDRFVASGTGFAPGDEVITESRCCGRIIQKHQRIAADGVLPPNNIAHGSHGADHTARYEVKTSSCGVVVDYTWGESALIRR